MADHSFVGFVKDLKIGLNFVDVGGPGVPAGQIDVPAFGARSAPQFLRSIWPAGAAGTLKIEESNADFEKKTDGPPKTLLSGTLGVVISEFRIAAKSSWKWSAGLNFGATGTAGRAPSF